MDKIDTLRAQAGRILYRELPEEYRYRDTPRVAGELGQLEGYLHVFGTFLDLIRATTEQAHADSFTEPQEDGREIQPWLIPYLADLLGTDLTAPDPKNRSAELGHAVRWFKSKGTLSSIDELGDVIAGTETVLREGWRHVATCPRVSLPPFTLPPRRAKEASDRAMRPLGCPDFRKLNRAVIDPEGANPLSQIKPRRDDPNGTAVFWRTIAPEAVPCFPGAYDDQTPRCPDLRDPDRTASIGPHPRRSLVHVRPPDGAFAQHMPQVKLSGPEFLARLNEIPVLRAGDLVADAAAVIVELPQEIVLPAGDITLDGLRFVNAAKPPKFKLEPGTNLTLENCAVGSLSCTETAQDRPAVTARNTIAHDIFAPEAAVELEYCTVMRRCWAGLLRASDCILNDLGDSLHCTDGDTASCLRYSALRPDPAKPEQSACALSRSQTNTLAEPSFLQLWFRVDPDDPTSPCARRKAQYGEPGYGVLNTDTPPEISRGAEDDGEMGAYHGSFHAASLFALRQKLTRFLPLGQDVTIFYDPMLSKNPPTLEAD